MQIISSLDLSNANDLEHAFAIEQRAHIFPASKSLFLTNQGNDYFNLKLELDNTMVGFLISHNIDNETSLFNIAIDPNHQKKGFAKQLILFWIDNLIQKEVTDFYLEVRISNLIAIKLYEHLQFKKIGYRKEYYPTNSSLKEDAFIMSFSQS